MSNYSCVYPLTLDKGTYAQYVLVIGFDEDDEDDEDDYTGGY